MKYCTLILLFALLSSCVNQEETFKPKIIVTDETDSLGYPIAAGCPGTVYDDWTESQYILPYPVGTQYRVSLSHCSGSYHSEGLPDEYAIDFNMDIGTKITASRAGTVVFVEESGIDGNHPNNLVVIDHGDDTFGQYMHLTKDGALVEVGAEVEKGDEIGLSGNTGLAGFPHLHLVFTTGGYEYPYVSYPTTFSNTYPNQKSLASGVIYPSEDFTD